MGTRMVPKELLWIAMVMYGLGAVTIGIGIGMWLGCH